MNIICFSDIRWDFLKHRHQHILERLPKDWNILFFQPSNLFRNSNMTKCSKIPDNIIVVTIPTLPYFDKNSFLRKINDKFIVFWSKYYAKKYNFNDSILLFYEPRFVSVIGQLNERLVWYEIVDDRLQFDEIHSWYLQYIEKLLKKSNVLTTSSKILYQKFSQNFKNIFYIPNAVDPQHFHLNEKISSPNDLKNINSPIIGYVGTIGEWFDFELIQKILNEYPDYSIVILGYVNSKFKKSIHALGKFKNFHNLGIKSYLDLPQYLQQFSCCIIPFKINELTNSVNPLKLYEYSAAGKNTISTNLPEIQEFSDIVYLAKDHDEFLNMIPKAITNQQDSQKLIKFAEEHNWNTTVNKIMSILKKYLKED